MHDEDSHVGWGAIHRAMTGLHGPQHDPLRWVVDSSLAYHDPRLESLCAYDRGDHWHFVTVGLSEVRDTRCARSELSGLGFEFTVRVRKTARGFFRRRNDRPPLWTIPLLKRLGDLALEGTTFPPGQTYDPRGPLTGEPTSTLVAVGFVIDPALRTIDTPTGKVSFVQLVGLTANELDDVRAGTRVLQSLAGEEGLYLIDPAA